MRLDHFLVKTGRAPSRTRAQRFIETGCIEVNGDIVRKCARKITPDDDVELIGLDHDYVSRGALKLVAGLEAFAIDPRGLTCLDIGASTGGFTEVLLRRGAHRVYAVDVGAGQLHPTLKADTRVVSIEKQNARSLSVAHIPQPIGLLVADVSFISLTKALPGPLSLCCEGAGLMCLVKPQFELGRQFIGRGGLVTAGDREVSAMMRGLKAWLSDAGWHVTGHCPSPVRGGDGTAEFLIGAEKKRDG